MMLYCRNFSQGDPTSSFSRDRRSIEVDPILDPLHVGHWLTHEASPRQKKEFSNVYDRYNHSY